MGMQLDKSFTPPFPTLPSSHAGLVLLDGGLCVARVRLWMSVLVGVTCIET